MELGVVSGLAEEGRLAGGRERDVVPVALVAASRILQLLFLIRKLVVLRAAAKISGKSAKIA